MGVFNSCAASATSRRCAWNAPWSRSSSELMTFVNLWNSSPPEETRTRRERSEASTDSASRVTRSTGRNARSSTNARIAAVPTNPISTSPASVRSRRASALSAGSIDRKITSVAPTAFPPRCRTRNRQIRRCPLYGSTAVYASSGRPLYGATLNERLPRTRSPEIVRARSPSKRIAEWCCRRNSKTFASRPFASDSW